MNTQIKSQVINELRNSLTDFSVCPGKCRRRHRYWGETSLKGTGLVAACLDTLRKTPSGIRSEVESVFVRSNQNASHYRFLCTMSLKVPSSKGVSWGPNITAFQTMMLFSPGAPLTPSGGSSWSRLKSRISRRRAAVDIVTFVNQDQSLWRSVVKSAPSWARQECRKGRILSDRDQASIVIA